jgi:uncharacterized Tic20 family protein
MQPSREERILAALSHASILANGLSFAGFLVTCLIWVLRRDRSEYIRVQSLQALAYQLASFALGLILLLAWGVCTFLSSLPIMMRSDLYSFDNPPIFFIPALVSLVIPALFIIACMGYGVIAAYYCYRGVDFRYIVIGHWFADKADPTPDKAPVSTTTNTTETPTETVEIPASIKQERAEDEAESEPLTQQE